MSWRPYSVITGIGFQWFLIRETPMKSPKVQRKLTAILSADVKGYSRLMADDDVVTVQTLTAYREVMSSRVQQHQGRVVDSPGDNVMAEFPSVVDAVTCAVEIQKGLNDRNSELPENRRMEFRIGINLGDVIVEGEQIYGDGVNIAARVEGFAEGGGISISGTVYDQVKNKLDLGYEFLGEQGVKNIAEPVRVYRVHMEPGARVPAAEREEKVEPAEEAKPTTGEAATILIVDDHEQNRRILNDQVLTLGHKPVQAENGISALAQVRKHPPDLILLDIMMPEMDGFQTLERLKAESATRHIPVVVISALDKTDKIVRCVEMGADDYMTKPFNSALLSARIGALLEKKSLHDQAEQYRQSLEDYSLRLEEGLRKQDQDQIQGHQNDG